MHAHPHSFSILFCFSFELAEPGGRIVYADFKKSDNIHRHKASSEGDYRFCFDNTFSSFNKKTVFFEIIIETEDGSPDNDDWNSDIFEGLSPEEYYDMKVSGVWFRSTESSFPFASLYS